MEKDTEQNSGFWPEHHRPLREVVLNGIAASIKIVGEEKTRAEVKELSNWLASLGADATANSLIHDALNSQEH